MFKRIKDWLDKPDQATIECRILKHQQSLVGKYDTPEFKALPHIEQVTAIMSDGIIPNLYRPKSQE